MLSRFARITSRQREIVEVVLRNGWGYMRQLLTGRKAGEPVLPPPAVLRNILVELGPVYVKLGQLLSTRPDLLPAAYIDALSDLQANVPPVAWVQVEMLLEEQFADRELEEIFTAIDREPVAAGSIAQIHRATLARGREVAVKIQRPDLDRLVARDIELIKLAADLVASTEFGRTYDIVELANEFAESLQAELNFTQEAKHTDRLRQNLADSRWFEGERLAIPEVIWEVTTDKVLVLEWLEGTSLLSAEMSGKPEAVQKERKAIARLLLRAFFQQICLDGFFHADPHPGNLFYLQGGQIALLDCGMVGNLDPRTQDILVELLLAISTLDSQRCARLILKLSPPETPIRLVSLQNDLTRLLRRYAGVSLAQLNFGQLFYEVLEAARKNQIRVPGNLGLCAKALANLEGVGRSLDPEFDVVAEIRPLATDLLQEQVLGNRPLTTALRALLDIRALSLQSPYQFGLILERFANDTLQWNLSLRELDPLRKSLDDSANRLSFSIVVGALIIGAATIATPDPTSHLFWVGNALFIAASVLGVWLLVEIIRSGGPK